MILAQILVFISDMFYAPLPKWAQRYLLKWTLKAYLKNSTYNGLCEPVDMAIASHKSLSFYVPVYSHENAVTYGDGSWGSYWWPTYNREARNTEPRIKFINWCLDQLK